MKSWSFVNCTVSLSILPLFAIALSTNGETGNFVKRSPRPVITEGSQSNAPAEREPFHELDPTEYGNPYNPKDYLGYVKKAVISANKNVGNIYFSDPSFLGAKPSAWLSRAEAMITKSPTLLDKINDYYLVRERTDRKRDKRLRGLRKKRKWMQESQLPGCEEMERMINATGNRYGNEAWFYFNQKIQRLDQPDVTEDEIEYLDFKCEVAEQARCDWSRSSLTALEAEAMAKSELKRFARAWQEEIDGVSNSEEHHADLISYAVNAIAWNRKSKLLCGDV